EAEGKSLLNSTFESTQLSKLTIRIEDEGGVIALVIAPLARRPVVAIPGIDRNPVELVDLGPVPRSERDVDVLAQWLVILRDREVAPVGRTLLLVRPWGLVPER